MNHKKKNKNHRIYGAGRFDSFFDVSEYSLYVFMGDWHFIKRTARLQK